MPAEGLLERRDLASVLAEHLQQAAEPVVGDIGGSNCPAVSAVRVA
jgi:hypothetical protein